MLQSAARKGVSYSEKTVYVNSMVAMLIPVHTCDIKHIQLHIREDRCTHIFYITEYNIICLSSRSAPRHHRRPCLSLDLLALCIPDTSLGIHGGKTIMADALHWIVEFWVVFIAKSVTSATKISARYPWPSRRRVWSRIKQFLPAARGIVPIATARCVVGVCVVSCSSMGVRSFSE